MEEKGLSYWTERPEVYEMNLLDYVEEYNECMNIAKEKEKKGNLDPYSSNYIPMTDEEVDLHKQDWRIFSKKRGFSDYDIAEYARWHKLSGQTDNLENAINDPWRRPHAQMTNWPVMLYIKHIEVALNKEVEIPETIIKQYEIVKQELEKQEKEMWFGGKNRNADPIDYVGDNEVQPVDNSKTWDDIEREDIQWDDMEISVEEKTR